jgi:hypothetical protein
MLRQCKLQCTIGFNKLDLVVVFAFRVDDWGHDEKFRDLDE